MNFNETQKILPLLSLLLAGTLYGCGGAAGKSEPLPTNTSYSNTGSPSSSSTSSGTFSSSQTLTADSTATIQPLDIETGTTELDNNLTKTDSYTNYSTLTHYLITTQKDIADADVASILALSQETYPQPNSILAYSKTFKISVPKGSEKTVLSKLAVNPYVTGIELVNVLNAESFTDNKAPSTPVITSLSTTTYRPVADYWGLDRIDQLSNTLDGKYTSSYNGTGVSVYLIDSGITTHSQLSSRIDAGVSFLKNTPDTDTVDCNGHATAVAGAIGGSLAGVANNVHLVPVRVLDCNASGTSYNLVKAINWAIDNAKKPAIINLSLTTPMSVAVNEAIYSAINTGISVIAAAGNNATDACNYSPASSKYAITAGSSSRTDSLSVFSNKGTCVKLSAPGETIYTLSNQTADTMTTVTGSSLSAAYTSGVAANLLEKYTNISPLQLMNQVISQSPQSLKGVTDATPLNLLYNFTVNSLPAAYPTMYISNLTSYRQLNKDGTWLVKMVIKVTNDSTGNPVSAAKIYAGFTSGGNYASCTTDSQGTCSVLSMAIPTDKSTTSFVVKSIESTLPYNPAKNVISSVIIEKPTN